LDEVRRLLALAWPVVLGQLGLVAMGVVDLLMVGPLGKEATAAVGIGNTLSFGTLIVGMGAAAGLDPLVAQAYGAGAPRRAGAEAARGMVIALMLAVPITLVHLYAEPILWMLRQPPSAIPGAAAFCRISALSVVPFVGFSVVRQCLQGGARMREAMWVIGIANLVNLVAAYVLVRWLELGVPGVAWGTTIVRWLMLGALVWLGWPSLREAWPEGPVLQPRELWRVAQVTLPVSLQLGLEVWAFNASSFFAGALGDTAAAAHTAALSAASVSFMVPLGIGAAAATRVGNLVGGGQDWRRAGLVAVATGAGVMTLSAALFLLWPEAIGWAYNSDPEVVVLIAMVLPVAAAFQWFDGTQVVSFGVLRGLGDTHTPALFNVVGHWLVGLPLGAWLAFGGRGMGLAGIWIGLTAGLGVVASLLVLRLLLHARANRGIVSPYSGG
jgi:MATE family multidrug resistance protein